MDSTTSKALGIVMQWSTSQHQLKYERLQKLEREVGIAKIFMKLTSFEHAYFRSMMCMCSHVNDDLDRCVGYIGSLSTYFSFPRYANDGSFSFEHVREGLLSDLFQLIGFKVCTYSNLPLDNDLAMLHILDWDEHSRFVNDHGTFEETVSAFTPNVSQLEIL
jgi:hypothetical protein